MIAQSLSHHFDELRAADYLRGRDHEHFVQGLGQTWGDLPAGVANIFATELSSA